VTPKRKEASSSQGDKVKKERKVYDLPGQTRETPDEVWLLIGAECARTASVLFIFLANESFTVRHINIPQ
jgi:hypothetical protein